MGQGGSVPPHLRPGQGWDGRGIYLSNGANRGQGCGISACPSYRYILLFSRGSTREHESHDGFGGSWGILRAQNQVMHADVTGKADTNIRPGTQCHMASVITLSSHPQLLSYQVAETISRRQALFWRDQRQTLAPECHLIARGRGQHPASASRRHTCA